MASAGAERRLAAIMFTDVVGSTAVMAESEERGRRIRERHVALVRPLVEAYGGQWIEEKGDEALSSFGSAVDAVNCALAIRAAVEAEPELSLRIGVHQGDVAFEGGRVIGDGVNVAARIYPLAEAGGIAISDEVQHAVGNQENVETRSLGLQELKNVPRPVEVFAISGTVAPPRPVSRVRARRRTRRRLRAVAWAVGVLMVLAVVAAWWLSNPELAPIRSIAVLPLENLSGDPEREYFADGMTEALIGELAKIGSLRVISRTSVMPFKGARLPLPEIAEQLGVEGVLEGTVIHEGERIRVTVQLIDARVDAHVWSERYDRKMGGMLALQSEIAEVVASEVRAELTPEERAGLEALQVDPVAYDAYVRGLELYATPGAMPEAIAAFELAVERAPRFALAYSWLATSRMRAASMYTTPASERAGMMPAALDAASRALELDERQGMAHSTIGLIRLFQWDFVGAGRSLERAMQLSPSDPGVLSANNWYLLMLERDEEAQEVAERLRLVAPLDALFRSNVARSFYYTRDYPRALKEFELARDLDGAFDPYHMFMVYDELGRDEESYAAEVALSRRYAALGLPGRDRVAAAQERGWAEAGRDGLIRAGTGVKIELAEQGLYSPYAIAMSYARIGEADKVLLWLERAYQEHEAVLYSLKAQPHVDFLRDDPRFQDLLRRIGFPES